jgi:hypothetical protein
MWAKGVLGVHFNAAPEKSLRIVIMMPCSIKMAEKERQVLETFPRVGIGYGRHCDPL